MAFKPEPTPSGRWRGGFRHPATGRKIRRTFDYQWEAESWAVTAEQQAREAANLSPVDLECDPPGLATGQGSASTELQAPAPRPGLSGKSRYGQIQPDSGSRIGPTLADYGQEYLARRRGSLSTQAWNKYASLIRGLDVPLGSGPISSHPVGLITRKMIQQWITDGVESGISNATVNARLAIIRRLYADMLADENGPLVRDPTVELDPLPEEERDDHVVLPDQELALLAAAEEVGGVAFRVAVLVGLDAGLRWQEAYALRPAALFNRADYLNVTHVVERGRDTLRPYTKSKSRTGQRKRSVPTTDRLREGLLELARGKADNELLFPSPKGSIFEYHNHRRRLWLPALHEIGAATRVEIPTKQLRKYGPLKGQPYMQVQYRPVFGFHALRHTYGTRLSLAGVPRSEIAILMGHSDERTTARYIHSGHDGRRLELVRQALAA